MFGSLMMLASGFLAKSPKNARSSSCFCVSVKNSGNAAIILPAKEMSRVSKAIPAGFTKDCTMGKKDLVAKAGASSVMVYMILALMFTSWLVCESFSFDKDIQLA